MSMFTVLDSKGHIVCRSRLFSIVIPYIGIDSIVLENGEVMVNV